VGGRGPAVLCAGLGPACTCLFLHSDFQANCVHVSGVLSYLVHLLGDSFCKRRRSHGAVWLTCCNLLIPSIIKYSQMA
jgi:hypothetical protein